LVKDALNGGGWMMLPLTSMLLLLKSYWRSQTAWRDLLSLRGWQMCSGGTRVPRKPTTPYNCYLGMSHGSMAMAAALQVWKSHAPAKYRFIL
jgi:hypothetical protein